MIVVADARHLPLADGSVDLAITAPPGDDYEPERARYDRLIDDVVAELKRVVRGRAFVQLVWPHIRPDDGKVGFFNLKEGGVEAEAGFYSSFPPELVRRYVIGHTKPSGVVLDPCCGLGTVPRIAKELGRVGWGCDLLPHRVERARRECEA